jgi:hypothetical protein
MKNKLLLATTVLCGFAAFASAGSVDVSVRGNVDAQAGFRSQSTVYKENRMDEFGHKNMGMKTKSKVYINAVNQSESGLKYGANVALKTDFSKQSTSSSSNKNRTFVFMEGEFGRVELGSADSVSKSMAIHAGTIAAATGGVDGDWSSYVDLYGTSQPSADTVTQQEYMANMKFMNAVKNSVDVATVGSKLVDKNYKLNFYTTRMAGFQLGLSYTPSANRGAVDLDYVVKSIAKSDSLVLLKAYINGKDIDYAQNVFSAGVNYAMDSKNMQFSVSAVADFADSVRSNGTKFVTSDLDYKNKLSSYAFGARLSFDDLSFVASYKNNGKSLKNKYGADTASERKYSDYSFNAGAAYEQGPLRASLTFAHGKFSDEIKNNSNSKQSGKVTAISLGADYKLAAGISTYAEVTNVSLKPTAVDATAKADLEARKNNATVFLVGAKLSF